MLKLSQNWRDCAKNCGADATAAKRRDASGYRNLERPRNARWVSPRCAIGPSKRPRETCSNLFSNATSPSTATDFDPDEVAVKRWDAWRSFWNRAAPGVWTPTLKATSIRSHTNDLSNWLGSAWWAAGSWPC